MSAFIISEATMDRVIWALRLNSNEFQGFSLDGNENASRMGRVLFKLNALAVSQRYNDTPSDEGAAYVFGKFYPTEEGLTNASKLKALACLTYQCCEGNVPDMKIYQDLVDIEEGPLFQNIDKQGPEYENAPWDADSKAIKILAMESRK